MNDRRCANCTRIRPAEDVFWHKQDRKWYCQAVFVCEHRLEVMRRRGDPAIALRDFTASGVSP